MTVLIPELRLKAIVDELLTKIKDDYEASVAANIVNESFLYRVFQGNEIDGYDLYVQAIDLLTRDDENYKKLETRLMYDRSRAGLPTIHITLPRETKGKENGLGFGRDSNTDLRNDDGSITLVNSRSFDTVYEMAITSSDSLQTIIIYNILKSGFIAIADSLELIGMKIPEYSGGDININTDLVPNVYMRSFAISIDYNYDVPTFIKKARIDQINFNKANTV